MSWLLKFTDWTVHYTRAEARFIFNFVRECTCRAIGTVVISYAAQLLVLWTSNSYTGGRTKSKTEQKIKEFNKTKKTRQKKKTFNSAKPTPFSFYLCRFSHISFNVCVLYNTWYIHVFLSHKYISFSYSFSVDEKCFDIFFSIRSSVHQASKTQLSFADLIFIYLLLLLKKKQEILSLIVSNVLVVFVLFARS